MNNEQSVRLDLFDLLAACRTQQDEVSSAIPPVGVEQVRALLMSADSDSDEGVVAELDALQLGIHAFDLGRDLLLFGDVNGWKHWLTIAADHGIEEARWAVEDDCDSVIPDDVPDGTNLTARDPVGEDVLLQALIRARTIADAARRDSEARFEEIFSASSVGMAISHLDGTLVRTNRALADILDHRRGRLTAERLEEIFHPEDVEYLRLRYQVLLEEDSLPFREQRRLLRADGEEALVVLSASVLRDPDGTPRYYVTSAEDVSEKHFLENQLQFQAIHDPLTGLVNRHRFLGLLEESLRGKQRVDGLTVFHVNLDGFRAINNGMGREAGDRLLQSVAAKLRQVFEGERATIARFDGDEFGVLLASTPNTPSIGSIATRINDELAEPVYIGAEGIAATATIAVAHRPPEDTQPAELLRATDTTLQRLRESGRRQWGMVDVDANERDRLRYTLAASMPGAWENGEIGIEYQPLVAVKDRRIVAVQALLQWEHTVHGRLGHDRFLDVMADTGQSVPIGRWMLSRACSQLRSWTDRFEGRLPSLYVELSAELAGDPDLVSTVRTVLTGAAIGPDQLQLGMPVQALYMTDGLAQDNLDVLVDLGISVVLYGFGTTRGDLACLEDLPVCAVKMSSEAVSRVERVGEDGLFTRAIRQLIPLVCESGIPVIVGEIETAQQFEWWREVGATTIQGNFTCAAFPADQIAQAIVA